MRQIISVSEITPQAPNTEFSFDVIYETDPVDETLPGLGLRLYFDSMAISLIEIDNLFQDGFLAQAVNDDTENLDEDATTDKFLNVAWADVVNTAWPGEGATPTTLYTATFTTADDFLGTTTLNFIGNAAANYELDTSSVTIESSGDPNENFPPSIEPQTFSIDENSPVDTVVGRVSANDVNEDVLTYSLDSDIFRITETGDIIVTDETALDFETTPSFEVEVTVSDGEFTDTATVTINLNDLEENGNETNTPPSFTEGSFTFLVNENVSEGTVVGVLTANDPDVNDTLSYSLDDNSPNLPFTVNENGEITVEGGLDFETNPSFTLTATVSDGEFTDTATVTITVNDVAEASGEVVFGSLENDILDGSDPAGTFPGNGELVFSGAGEDTIDASTGDGGNRIYAGSEDDVIIAGVRDRAFAGDGDDEITGNGENRLYGQAGNDLFRIGATGNNTVFGGTGSDDFLIANNETLPETVNQILDFTPGEDRFILDRADLNFEDDIILTQEETAIPTTIVSLSLPNLEQGQPLVRLPGVEITDLSAEDFAFDVSVLG